MWEKDRKSIKLEPSCQISARSCHILDVSPGSRRPRRHKAETTAAWSAAPVYGSSSGGSMSGACSRQNASACSRVGTSKPARSLIA
jgi:hypothetical protein